MTWRRAGSVLIVAGWVAAVGIGMNLLWGYARAPGRAAAAHARWPEESGLHRSPDRPTLVMFAHPRCPCTRASISELARLMSDVRGRVDGRVLVLKVEGTEEGWEQTDLWRSAAAIPGVQVSRDDSGRAAAAFGAATSGQTFFYDASGELRFAGGLTPSRGHQGDSLGRAVILATVNEGRIGQVVTDVFGCGLTAERGAR